MSFTKLFVGCESDCTIKQKEINGTNNDEQESGINSMQQENLVQSNEGKENVDPLYLPNKRAKKTHKVNNFRTSTSD